MDDEHEDKRFDQGNTQRGIPRDDAEPDSGIQPNQKVIAGTDVETSSARLIMTSMGEATRRTVTDGRR